jgi:hypothetical protein
MAYTIVWCHAGISAIVFVQTLLSLLGRSGQQGFAQKDNTATKYVHTSGTLYVELALLLLLLPLSMYRSLCHCHDGIIAIVGAQASPPLLN